MNQQILQELNSPNASQGRVLEYFEQLKQSEDGWQICMNTLTTDNSTDYHVKFFCFQVIEFYVKNSYPSQNEQQKQVMKEFLSQWIQSLCSQVNTKLPSFLLNKSSQIFSMVFLCDFPATWPSFFNDLLQTFSMGSNAVELYLRILKDIDSEIADREFLRSQAELERNTLIKDTVREHCIQDLVDSWFHILTQLESGDIKCLCLQVLGSFVSWIDINLIANNRFVPVLVQLLSVPDVRESSADCIHEILFKGMDPLSKTKLVESFVSILNEAGVLKLVEDDDSEFMVKLSRVINAVGVNLLDSHTKLLKIGDKESATAVQIVIAEKVPLMLQFLGSDYDDVSGAVMEFARNYTHFLKTKPLLTTTQKQHLQNMLFIIIKKMKYDDSYNFKREGEEEALFMEYRHQLKILLDNVSAVDRDLVLTHLQQFIMSTLQQWRQVPFQDVEAAITLFYFLGEALPTSEGNHFAADQAKGPAMQNMMQLLVTCGASAHPNSCVSIQFFKTVVRYDKFFHKESQLIPEVLVVFMDERGLRHPTNSQVRGSCVYYFTRFIKSLKSHMQPYIEDLLKRLQEHLVPFQIENGVNGVTSLLIPDDQNYLYEAAGILIISGLFKAHHKAELMRTLLSPIITRFPSVTEEFSRETDDRKREALAQCLSHAMAYVSRTSKAFSNQQTVKACHCVPVYLEALQVFLPCLQIPYNQAILQSGVRQYLHRMVVCLEDELLAYIPTASEGLFRPNDIRSVQEYIPLINQIIVKFKKEIIPFLHGAFPALVNAVFAAFSSPCESNDEDARLERQQLQRSYYLFISVIVNNGVTEVMTAEGDEGALLQQVILSVTHGAVEFADPVSQKNCFTILKKLVEIWGGDDGPPGFKEFMYKHILPTCFLAPMKEYFDLGDAQTVAALTESALCLKAMLNKRGDEFMLYLHNQYLPTLDLSPDRIEEYCMALKSDQKIFKAYLKTFFQTAKS